MQYKKQAAVSGQWVKASELKTGTRAKIVAETVPTPSQFEDKNGGIKMQDVTKVRFEGIEDSMNVNLNRATLNGLIEAFGEDSKDWINKYLTVHTEKMIVGGKRVTALYLLPEGFEAIEDDGGYMIVTRKGAAETKAEVSREVGSYDSVPEIEYPEGQNPKDIPF